MTIEKTKPYKEQLRELGRFSLEKRGMHAGRTANFKFLERYPTEDGRNLFSVVAPEGRAQNKGLELCRSQSPVSARKHIPAQ